jgi:adenylate cyclase
LFLNISNRNKVQVKGKTEGKKVYWPIPSSRIDVEFEKEIKIYSDALELYYKGKWPEARELFSKCNLNSAEVFKDRLKGAVCPKEWNGIWTMSTK